MGKLTPEQRERIRRHREESREARRKLQEILDRVEARRQARREEWLNRPRGLRRLLFWTR
jgi:ferritin-like metal-binding protein YciE